MGCEFRVRNFGGSGWRVEFVGPAGGGLRLDPPSRRPSHGSPGPVCPGPAPLSFFLSIFRSRSLSLCLSLARSLALSLSRLGACLAGLAGALRLLLLLYRGPRKSLGTPLIFFLLKMELLELELVIASRDAK